MIVLFSCPVLDDVNKTMMVICFESLSKLLTCKKTILGNFMWNLVKRLNPARALASWDKFVPACLEHVTRSLGREWICVLVIKQEEHVILILFGYFGNIPFCLAILETPCWKYSHFGWLSHWEYSCSISLLWEHSRIRTSSFHSFARSTLKQSISKFFISDFIRLCSSV